MAASGGGGGAAADDATRRALGKQLGAASLVDQLDKQVIVCMRDGRSIFGCLRSFDQYANLVLEYAAERIVVEDSFGDVPLGLFLVRGENVVLLGEVDASKEILIGQRLQKVSADDIQRASAAQKKNQDAIRRHEKLEWPLQEEF